MAKELSQKIQAFKKLLKIADEGSFELYATSGDIYGERAWPVDCMRPIRDFKHSKKKTRQQVLDETLINLTQGDFPATKAQMKKEQDMIHLTLLAGADPNTKNLDGRSVFESFWIGNKMYGMLELAKDSRFLRPTYLDEMYKGLKKDLAFYLHWGKTYPFGSQEIQDRNRQGTENAKDLIYTLFQNDMIPQDKDIFKSLTPIVLQKNPQFFDKKKEQVQKSLARAKTPLQIYTALMGKRKEKN